MFHMTHTKVHRVVPGKKAEKMIEDLIEPLCFEGGTVAQFMDTCLHPHKSVEHAVDITDGKHRYPQPLRKKIVGKVDRCDIDKQDTASLQEPLHITSIGKLFQETPVNRSPVPIDLLFHLLKTPLLNVRQNPGIATLRTDYLYLKWDFVALNLLSQGPDPLFAFARKDMERAFTGNLPEMNVSTDA
jgi:hypothetical protein